MTKTFKKTALAMAVAAASAAVVPVTQAVNLAEDGLGEVGIVPYYTVRNGMDTYLSVTNTSSRTAVFKIRFRESLNSRDVRDFNVVLSPKDVWTAAVTRNADDSGARVVTADRSCTVPISIRNNGGIDFTSIAYDGTLAPQQPADGGPTGLDRTKEGYFEVINMGTAIIEGRADSLGVVPLNQRISYYAKHVNGEPRDCNEVEKDFVGNADAARIQFGEPMNVLKVNAAFIKVDSGTGFTNDPVILANFWNPGVPATDGLLSTQGGTNIVRTPSNEKPDMNDVTPQVSSIHTATVGQALNSSWTTIGTNRAIDAVSALIQRTNVINQFRVEEGAADTDWVVTFPTKSFYVDPALVGATAAPYRPFPKATDPTTGLACVTVHYNFVDREEGEEDNPDVVLPSPLPPGATPDQICHEANVLTLGNGVTGSSAPYKVEPPYTAGWINLAMDQGTVQVTRSTGLTAPNPTTVTTTEDMHLTDDAGNMYAGLPVVGFAMTELDNLNSDKPDVQYGFLWNHSYTRLISSN